MSSIVNGFKSNGTFADLAEMFVLCLICTTIWMKYRTKNRFLCEAITDSRSMLAATLQSFVSRRQRVSREDREQGITQPLMTASVTAVWIYP